MLEKGNPRFIFNSTTTIEMFKPRKSKVIMASQWMNEWVVGILQHALALQTQNCIEWISFSKLKNKKKVSFTSAIAFSCVTTTHFHIKTVVFSKHLKRRFIDEPVLCAET